MDPVVRFRAAVCLLGRFPALAGVDLDVNAGEIVLLQGPNGAGKTTLLRACAGLVKVAQGEASVLGVNLVDDPKAVRPLVGLLGHATGLYDDLSVSENIRFWTRAGGASLTDADNAMARLGLDGRLASVPVARLSAGQRRRSALAVLLARRPRLWLLDEPHAALDQAGRDLVDSLMVDAVNAGATVLFASHELDRAQEVADRSVHVVGGTTQPSGNVGHTSEAVEVD
ncbi:MAG: heme ABC exporter ATP-binding protein CcmA [Acidimicrobiales bacterium]|nr:heme ABC exporter ATP-binding protein CcmA [Acidimicrobiales bacterium]